MTLGYSDIEFGDKTLYIQTLTRNKVPGSIKQKIGGSLVKTPIPARRTRDWSIVANGVIFNTDSKLATTARSELEGLNDLEKHHYSDGLITGSFIIEDLKFADSDDKPLHFEYTITLIEFNN